MLQEQEQELEENNMLAQKNILAFFVFITLLSGCERYEANKSKSHVNQTTSFFMGSSCGDRENNITATGYYPADAESFSCLDSKKNKVYFTEKNLKVTLLKNGFSRVALSCVDSKKHKSFIDSQNDNDVLLVFENTLIWSFRVGVRVSENDCGSFAMTSHEDAVLLCLSAQEAWGGDQKDCSTSCEDTKSEVCLDN